MRFDEPTLGDEIGNAVKGLIKLVVLLGLCAFLFSYFTSGKGGPGPTWERIGPEAIHVSPLHFQYIAFEVGPVRRFVVGRFVAQGGSGNDIEAYLVDEDGLLNFQNSHPFRYYFESGKVTAGRISVGPLATGRYYLIYSNAFSLLSSKTVDNQVGLQASP